MDTTPKYILMCEKAEEIQKGWIPHSGDFVGEGRDYSSMVLAYTDIINAKDASVIDVKKVRPNARWLPRQDQLQERVKYRSVTHPDDVYIKIEKFYQYVNEVMSGKIESMEQLWLGFVMKEKHQKAWNGKEWVIGQGC